MAKKPDDPKPPSAEMVVQDLLAYRLPQSGKALGSIVLSRAQAEELLAEISQLREKQLKAEAQILEWSLLRSASPSLE